MGRLLLCGFAVSLASSHAMGGQIPAKSPALPVGLTAQEFDSHWRVLSGDDAAKAYRSIWTLVRQARQGVPFIKERLRPVAAVDPKQTTQLLADLDSNRFAARLKAANALEALGKLAEPALRQALSNKPSLEMRQRIG